MLCNFKELKYIIMVNLNICFIDIKKKNIYFKFYWFLILMKCIYFFIRLFYIWYICYELFLL